MFTVGFHMDKISIEVNVRPCQRDWVLKMAQQYALPDEGKAWRCCVNFASQTAQDLNHTTLETEDTVLIPTKMTLAQTQAAWFNDYAAARFENNMSATARGLICCCMAQKNPDEVAKMWRKHKRC
jgi:hypothetical protein